MNTPRFLSATLCLLAGVPPGCWADCSDIPTELSTHTNAFYIPRDAPIGSLIGYAVVNYDSTREHRCTDKPVVHQMLLGPRLPPMRVATSEAADLEIGEHLYATHVPGVGFAASHKSGRFCTAPGVDYQGSRYFPFSARSCDGYSYQTRIYYYLYKTGVIAPGTHTLNQPALKVIFDGQVQSSLDLGQTITVAGCAMPEFADNQIEVQMPRTLVGDFTGPGTAGPAQLFVIPMHSCVRGVYSSYYPWNYFQGNYANVRLEPARGSTLIDARQGIVGLKPDSTAQGVGVQILRDDMSPMELGVPVQVRHVEDGETQLPFRARYVQLGDAAPKGGTADATVSFTVTFQ
jgi:type 1 fimbria pilin